MILVTGEVTSIDDTGGVRTGLVRVGGASLRVSLALLDNIRVGDAVLVEAGVAIGKVEPEQPKENADVPGNSGKSS